MKRLLKSMRFEGFLFFYLIIGLSVIFYNTPGIDIMKGQIGFRDTMLLFFMEVGVLAAILEFLRVFLERLGGKKNLNNMRLWVALFLVGLTLIVMTGVTVINTLSYIIGIVVIYALMVVLTPYVEARLEKEKKSGWKWW